LSGRFGSLRNFARRNNCATARAGREIQVCGARYQVFGQNSQERDWRADHLKSIAKGNPAHPKEDAMFGFLKAQRRQLEARPYQETVAHTFCDVFREEDARGLARLLLTYPPLRQRSLTATGMSVALTKECKRRRRDGTPFGTKVLCPTHEKAEAIGVILASTVKAGHDWWQAIANITKWTELDALPDSLADMQSHIKNAEELQRRGYFL
jgi:hypothetical protein